MDEHTLDRVRHQDFYFDLRTAPATARAWLDRARPVYDAGSSPWWLPRRRAVAFCGCLNRSVVSAPSSECRRDVLAVETTHSGSGVLDASAATRTGATTASTCTK